MKTQLYPMVQFKKDTWEIDEFDCASIFVLVGEEKALVIDAGIGIGDLLGAIRTRITDKPLIVVATHGHGDHIDGMDNFEEYYLDERDWHFPEEETVPSRVEYAQMIAQRQGGWYAYDVQRDITDWQSKPKRLKLTPYMEFDLGGGRVVKSYPCPGHSPGQVAFLDRFTRSLFCGDALNCNLGYGFVFDDEGADEIISVERALEGLQLFASLGDQYDGIYNGHHDYRPLGAPLDGSVLPDAIDLCKQLISGEYNIVLTPNPFALYGGPKFRQCVKKGMTEIAFNPDTILQSQLQSLGKADET